jgi:hypothetical protein
VHGRLFLSCGTLFLTRPTQFWSSVSLRPVVERFGFPNRIRSGPPQYEEAHPFPCHILMTITCRLIAHPPLPPRFRAILRPRQRADNDPDRLDLRLLPRHHPNRHRLRILYQRCDRLHTPGWRLDYRGYRAIFKFYLGIHVCRDATERMGAVGRIRYRFDHRSPYRI